MTVEKLNAKLVSIRKQKEQALANYNALNGAEQMLLQLIGEFKETESEAVENATDND
jgi:hypothetical protein